MVVGSEHSSDRFGTRAPAGRRVPALTGAVHHVASRAVRVTISTRRWSPDGARRGPQQRVRLEPAPLPAGADVIDDSSPAELVRTVLSAVSERAVEVEEAGRPGDDTHQLRVVVAASAPDPSAVPTTLALVTLDRGGALRRLAFSPFAIGSGRSVAAWTRLDFEPA
jgi:hypothetical protein